MKNQLGLIYVVLAASVSAASGAIVGSWPGFVTGSPYSIDVVNQRAYVALNQAGIGIYDVSNPTQAVRLGGYDTPSYARDVKVVGNIAYVADYYAGLLVLDVSTPAAPVQVGSLPTLGSRAARSLDVAGGFVYLVDALKGLQIIDVTNPAEPLQVGSYIASDASAVDVSGQHAYLATPGGLRILNVSNPANPLLEGSWNTGSVVDVQVVGNVAYLALGWSGWQMVDVSNPAAPVGLNLISSIGYLSALHVAGSRAYVIDGGDLFIYSATNPQAPLGNYLTPGYNSSVTASGTNVFVGGEENGVLVLNVANPSQPMALSIFSVPFQARALQLVGPRAYVADALGGMRVLDLTTPANPVSVGALYFDQSAPHHAYDIAVSGDYAYVAAGALQVVSITNPSSPVRVGGYSSGANADRVQVANNYVWLLDNYTGLHILSLTNPAAPVRVGGYNHPNTKYALEVAGNYAYVSTDGPTNLHILDVSNPANPIRVGTYGNNSYFADVVVVGPRAYVAGWRPAGPNFSWGLDILDVSQPSHPVRLGHVETEVQTVRITVSGNLVYLANIESGVLVVDVSNPMQPVCAGGFDTEGYAYHVALSGSNAVVADFTGGLLIATLPIDGGPFIVYPPQSLHLLAGQTATFNVAAQCGPFTYQWRFNGVDLAGANLSQLTITNVFTNQAGNYSVVVSNGSGAVTSAVATLTVELQPPVIFSSAATNNLLAGDTLYVNYPVSGAPFPSLQWRFNGVFLTNTPNLYLVNLQTNQSGNYTLVASNVVGQATSAVLQVTVRYEAPTVTPFSTNVSVLAGSDTTVCAQAIGGPPPALQWQFEGVNLAGQTNACLFLSGVDTNQSGHYTLVVSNLAGMATSSVINVSIVQQLPEFVREPFSQSAVEGTDIHLIGQAIAGPPATYYLLFNGTNVPVPYTYVVGYAPPHLPASFGLLEVTTNDAGNYQIVASNVVGAVTSQVATVGIRPAGPLDRWTQRNPLPQSQPILSLAHNGSLFVGVGERGMILTSTNGIDWATQRRRVDTTLQGVTWGDGQFIAVGAGGVILSSADGTNWTHRFSVPPGSAYVFDFFDVAHGNGTYVAMGNNVAAAFTSTDGVQWESHNVSGTGYKVLPGIAFGQNLFVAVGHGIYTSPDGATWTQRSPQSTFLEQVAFLNGVFVAVGDNGFITVSADGLTWNTRTSGTTRRLIDVAYGGGRYVAVGARGVLRTSLDAITWTAGNSGTPDRLEAITFAEGLLVAAGENGTTITSPDALTWTKRNFGTTRDLDGMIVADDIVVIVGKAGVILRSIDGVNFAEQATGTTNNLHGVGAGQGIFVAVGEPGEILTSPDGANWTHRDSGNTNSLKSVAYSPNLGLWVAVGTEGTLLTSSNAVVWTSQTLAPYPYDLNAVAWGNGVFVVGGDGPGSMNGSLFYSANGTAWTPLPAYGKNIRGVAFGNGFFLATANDDQLLESVNGISWFPHFIVQPVEGQNLRAAYFAHGIWTVVGNDGIIFTTTNTFGVWTRRPSRTFENLHGMGELGGRLVTMGNRGTILESDQFAAVLETPVVLGGGRVQVPFRGVLNRIYELQASTNLGTWTILQTFTNTTERTLLEDANAASHPRRFYRLYEP